MIRANIVFRLDHENATFRMQVEKIATYLKLVGRAKKTKDGTVKVVCEGERDVIERLISEITKDPGFVTNRSMSATYTESTGKYKKFKVKYGDPIWEYIHIKEAEVMMVDKFLDKFKTTVRSLQATPPTIGAWAADDKTTP